MRKVIWFLALLGLVACNQDDPADSTECIQAKNRERVYTISLHDLQELYKGELDTQEAKRRISAMEQRIENAKTYISNVCTRK